MQEVPKKTFSQQQQPTGKRGKNSNLKKRVLQEAKPDTAVETKWVKKENPPKKNKTKDKKITVKNFLS